MKKNFLILLIILSSATLTGQNLSFFKDSTQLEFLEKAILEAPQKIIPEITVKKVNITQIILNSNQPKPVYFDVKPNIVDLKDVALPLKIKGFFTKKPLRFAKTIKAPHLLFRDNSKRNIKYLDKAHGSFSDAITSITQDSIGVTWIGSADAGLSRYNAISFKIVNESVGLVSNTVEGTLYDSDNRLWIGSSKGIQYIKNDFLYTLKGDFKIFEFAYFYEDLQHNIWVSTRNNGCLKYDGKNWFLFNEKSGLTKGGISAVYQDKKGNYWFGSWAGKGVTRFDGQKFYNYKPENLKLGIDFHAFAEYEGKLWMGTYAGGLVVYDKDQFYRYDFFSKQKGNIYSFAINKNGLWFNLYGLGVANYRNGKFYYFFKDDGLRGAQSYKIFSDKNCNIWIADLFFGFERIDQDLFYKETYNNQFVTKQVAGIEKDLRGNLWTFPNGGLITKLQKNKLTTYLNNYDYKTPPINHSYDGYFTENNKAWFSTIAAGLVFFNNKTFTFYNFNKHNTFGKIVKDNSGSFWFASDNSGAVIKTKKGFFEFGKKQGLASNNINTLYYNSSDSAVWIAVKDYGIAVVKNNKISYANKYKGLISNQIISIYKDSENRIWLSSENNGVQLIDGKKTYTFNESNGLLSNKSESVVEGELGVYWVTSSMGLSKISFIKNNSIDISTYDQSYGTSLIGLSGSVNSNGKGKVIWGSEKGLLVYNKNNENTSVNLPYLYIEDISLKGESVLNSYKKGPPIILYPNSQLKVSANAINWGYESTLKYDYSLNETEETPKEWRRNNNKGIINLNNFSLNNRILYIKVTNRLNLSQIIKMPLIVKPYFYQNIYYHIMFWVILIGLSVFYYQYKKRLAIKNKKELEQIIIEKTKEITSEKEELEKSHKQIVIQNKEKDVLVQEVHHRVKNNLQLISSLVSMQLNSLKSEKSKKILEETYNRINSMALVHEILYNKENVSFISLKDYLSDLISSISEMMNQDKTKIVINKYFEDINIDVSYCIALGMITNEAISNIIKHAFKKQENPEITINLYCDSKSNLIIYSIKDNGIGINPKYLNTENKSLGLRLINIFSKQLKAQLEINNKNGTEIVVKFKCKHHENCNLKQRIKMGCNT